MFVILIFASADRWLPTWAVANGAAPKSAPVPRKLATADLRLTWDGVEECFEGIANHSDTLAKLSILNLKDRLFVERKIEQSLTNLCPQR